MPSTFADDDPVCHFIYPYVSGGIAWGLKKNQIKWAPKFMGLPEGAFFLGGVNLGGGVLKSKEGAGTLPVITNS